MTKTPTPTENPRATRQHQNAPKNATKKSWKQFRIEGSSAKADELITNWQRIEAKKY